VASFCSYGGYGREGFARPCSRFLTLIQESIFKFLKPYGTKVIAWWRTRYRPHVDPERASTEPSFVVHRLDQLDSPSDNRNVSVNRPESRGTLERSEPSNNPGDTVPETVHMPEINVQRGTAVQRTGETITHRQPPVSSLVLASEMEIATRAIPHKVMVAVASALQTGVDNLANASSRWRSKSISKLF